MTDLRAKFTLELDDRMSAAARRALGDFAGGVNDVNSAARRGRDALELFTRSGKRAGRGAKDASDDVGLLAAAQLFRDRRDEAPEHRTWVQRVGPAGEEDRS